MKGCKTYYPYTPYSARMSTHKLKGFYMEGLILGVNTMYTLFCFFKAVSCRVYRVMAASHYSLTQKPI